MAQRQPRHIIFLIDSLGLGGAERLLVTYLQHFPIDRFEARVCACNVRDGNPMADDIRRLTQIPVDMLLMRRLTDPRGLPRLLRYLHEQRADLIHTQLLSSNILGGIAGKMLGIPVVSTQHIYDAPPKGTRSYWRRQLMWWVLRHCHDRIIAVSEGTRRHHLRMGRLAPDKIVTLYNGIDLSAFTAGFEANRQATRRALGIPPDAPLLITVAVLRPAKGIQYLLEALPAILEAMPEARYLVVGSGDYEDHLKGLATSYGLADRVIFTGVRHDVPNLLSISDLFVLPTLDEALPTVLAEAMAAQKPIVASRVGGVPEMVEHGCNGLLVPPADPASLAHACLQVLQNPDQARAMACAGREIVEQRFNIQRQVGRLGDLYQQVLAERERRNGR
jgi:glycosyltransferase involved in cell wall biosynthesis